MKSLSYYKMMAPFSLHKQGLPITKENIEAEAKRLKEEDEKLQNNK